MSDRSLGRQRAPARSTRAVRCGPHSPRSLRSLHHRACPPCRPFRSRPDGCVTGCQTTANTDGCKFGKIFATPGWRNASVCYSHQYNSSVLVSAVGASFRRRRRRPAVRRERVAGPACPGPRARRWCRPPRRRSKAASRRVPQHQQAADADGGDDGAPDVLAGGEYLSVDVAASVTTSSANACQARSPAGRATTLPSRTPAIKEGLYKC